MKPDVVVLSFRPDLEFQNLSKREREQITVLAFLTGFPTLGKQPLGPIIVA